MKWDLFNLICFKAYQYVFPAFIFQVASDSESSDDENVDDPEPVLVDSPPPPQVLQSEFCS